MNIVASAIAQPLIEEIYQVRAQTYSAYNVSRDLLERVNRSGNISLRTQLASEVGRGTGREIQSTWLHRANEYMSQVNNRGYMDPNAIEASPVEVASDTTQLEIKKPNKPNRVEFDSNIESIKSKMISTNKAIRDQFNRVTAIVFLGTSIIHSLMPQHKFAD